MRTLSFLSDIFLYMAYIFQCSNVSLKQNACLGISTGFLCNICRVGALESITFYLIIPKLCIYDEHDFFL